MRDAHASLRYHLAGTINRVSTGSKLEDERGVDRQQIRELLTLTPAERVDRLVTTVAVWNEILAQAGGSPDAR